MTPELLPALGLLAAVLVLFKDAILSGELFYEQDTLLFYYPLTQWFAAHLTDGHFPLWLPHIFSGYPIAADGEIGPLYPIHLLALLVLEPGQALIWGRMLHFYLGALFMYALLRVLGAGRLGSTVGGLTFAFGGFLAAQMHHENVVRTAVWLPLVLLLAELALRRRGWPHQQLLVAAGVVFGIALLGLHVQPALMIAMAVAGYVVLRTVDGGPSTVHRPPSTVHALARSALRSIWAIGLIFGLGATLAAVQLMPLYEQGRVSFRGGGLDYEFASAFGVVPSNLATLVFPYFFRLPDGAWWMLWTPWETLFYAGLVPLLLAPLGLVGAPRRLALYFAALAVFSVLVAMAHYGPLNLHEALWHLPGLSFLRAPGRFSYLFVFAIAGLAAFGADWLARPERSSRGLALLAAAPLGLLGLLVWLLHAWRTWLLADPDGSRAALEATYLGLRRQFAEVPTPEMVYQGLLWSTDLANPKTLLSLGLIAGLALLVAARAGRWTMDRGRSTVTRPPRFTVHGPRSIVLALWSLVLVGLVAVDVLVFAYDFHPRASLATLSRPDPLLQALAQQPGARVLAGPGVASLEPNLPVLFGLRDLNGYSSLPSQRHFDYWSRVHNLPDVWLDLWGAELYVADDGGGAIERSGYRFNPARPLLQGAAGNPSGSADFRVPSAAAAEVHVIGWLSHAAHLEDGTRVAEIEVAEADGRTQLLTLRIGQHLAERAYDRADVRPIVRHGRPTVIHSVEERHGDGSVFPVHFYLARLPLDEPAAVTRLSVRALLEESELRVFGLALADLDGQPIQSLRPTDREKLEPLQQVGSATIYRNTAAYPRSFIVQQGVRLDPARDEPPVAQMFTSAFDPAWEVLLERAPVSLAPRSIGEPPPFQSEPVSPAAARVEELSTGRLRIYASLDEPGFVVLTDLYHRGWQATVNGEPTRVYLANGLFRAVAVPAGQHVIELAFDPLTFRLGAFLSLQAVFFAAVVLLGPALVRRGSSRI